MELIWVGLVVVEVFEIVVLLTFSYIHNTFCNHLRLVRVLLEALGDKKEVAAFETVFHCLKTAAELILLEFTLTVCVPDLDVVIIRLYII